jgi:hypothetical protein
MRRGGGDPAVGDRPITSPSTVHRSWLLSPRSTLGVTHLLAVSGEVVTMGCASTPKRAICVVRLWQSDGMSVSVQAGEG